jgi:hypothetical protein
LWTEKITPYLISPRIRDQYEVLISGDTSLRE